MRNLGTVSLLALFALALAISTSAVAQTSSSQSQSSSQMQNSPQTTQQQPPSQTQQSADDDLQLTPDQKQKIPAIVDDENKQIETVRNDSSLSLEQKQQKVVEVRQVGAPKIRAILTPEQLQKLAAAQQRARQQQSQPSTNQNATPSQR